MIEVGKEIKVIDPGKKLLHVQKMPLVHYRMPAWTRGDDVLWNWLR